MADPGASTPSSFTVNYDALLSTTLFGYRDKMVDNIFKNNAFLAAMRLMGGLDFQDGGERVAMPLMTEENSTVKSYKGYDIIDTTPQDGMTTAFYEWSEIGGSISISRREERQNSGEAAILRLLEKKTQQAEMTIKEKINKQMVQGTVSSATFVPGNDSKDLIPLGNFLPKAIGTDPVSGGSIGNINRANNSWWRPYVADLSTGTLGDNTFAINVTTYAGLRAALFRMYNFCSRGADGSGPGIVLSDQVAYETYENSLDQLKRYGNDDLVSMGFDNVKLKGATMIWDEQVPDLENGTVAITTGTSFFINPNFMKIVIDSETNFVTTPFIEPENQTAKTAKVLFMGQLASDNMRKHGMCFGISQSIVS